MTDDSWDLRVDTGGTFTDCLACDPQGGRHHAKVLSSAALRGTVRRWRGPRRLEIKTAWAAADGFLRGFEFRRLGQRRDGEDRDVTITAHTGGVIELARSVEISEGAAFEVRRDKSAPLLAARLVTSTPGDQPLPSIRMRLATTRATNALLERRGAPCVLLTTRGFGDVLTIGDQRRPDLFALTVRKPPPLTSTVIEVGERIDAAGVIIEPIDLDHAREAVRELHRETGIDSAAVALVNAWRNPVHEDVLLEMLLAEGFQCVVGSAARAPIIGFLARAETAVLDACLGPVIDPYLASVSGALSEDALHVMTSTGGLVGSRRIVPRDMLLSGPAGGVIGASAAGARSGVQRIISFDMGGTSTDVARVEGIPDYRFELEVGGVRVAAPGLDIETVAAGGGSICRIDTQGLHVGPLSAGADPGPACYGAGGPLTLTDVNLLSGRLCPDRFEVPIDREAADSAIELILADVPEPIERDAVLDGFMRLADEHMADAIAEISHRRGYDPAAYALVAFGGAGGQHACAVARRLDIQRVLLPRDGSLLSASGLEEAVIERFAHRQVLEPLDDVTDRLQQWTDDLSRRARDLVLEEGVAVSTLDTPRVIVNLRLVGQVSVISCRGLDDLDRTFRKLYRKVYGYDPDDSLVEVESIRVAVATLPKRSQPPRDQPPQVAAPTPRSSSKTRFHGRWIEVPVFERDDLAPGHAFAGPALVVERYGVSVVEAGWSSYVDSEETLRLTHQTPADEVDLDRGDLATTTLLTHRLQTIARQMGRTLERISVSTNVKERLDFSCAVLDDTGALLVNAPHVPVHLGALGLCVRSMLEAVSFGPGDVFVTNHPGFGGSHLPDITVVSAVDDDRGARMAYVASRAHHAEIGGRRPGSMSPESRCLAEEGVVIPVTAILSGGRSRLEDMTRRLGAGPWPSRAVAENIADLRAAVAANQVGIDALRALAGSVGSVTLRRHMRSMNDRTEAAARRALAALPEGERHARTTLDDGTALSVTIRPGKRTTIDFTGSAPVHPGPMNTPLAVVQSAVIYVLRLVAGAGLPLNDGLLRAVELVVPPGLLNPGFRDPLTDPAVAGGNVEVSQRLCELLLKALGLAAASQGTMNNLVFGDEQVSFYETIGGGAGATADGPGADGVHTHMTNTRITDVEVLEHLYPVRLDRFALRRGSGGRGRYRGGDGLVRAIVALRPLTFGLLTQHRREGPSGALGGADGAPGRQCVERLGGGVEELGATVCFTLDPGDRLVIETPGGGGWGGNHGALRAP